MCFSILASNPDADQKILHLGNIGCNQNVILSNNFGQKKTAPSSFGELEAVGIRTICGCVHWG